MTKKEITNYLKAQYPGAKHIYIDIFDDGHMAHAIVIMNASVVYRHTIVDDMTGYEGVPCTFKMSTMDDHQLWYRDYSDGEIVQGGITA